MTVLQNVSEFAMAEAAEGQLRIAREGAGFSLEVA
jgi:hypothetical protein